MKSPNMDKLELARNATQMLLKANKDMDRLVSLLEIEPLWLSRRTLPEPLKTQLMDKAIEIENNKMSRLANISANEEFLSKLLMLEERLQITPNMTPVEIEYLDNAMSTVHEALETIEPAREHIRFVINFLRESRGAPPLDGSESEKN